MKYVPSVLASQYSGSAGSTTASRGRWGSYMRRRSMVTNPNTEQQTTVRQAFGSLAAMWAGLGDARWAAWNAYAAATVWTDRMGQQIRLSGQQHFIRSNQPQTFAVAMGAAGLPGTPFLDAPEVNTLGTQPLITLVELVVDDGPPAETTLAVSFSNSVNTDFVYVFLGGPVNAQKSYFKGPYKLANANAAPVAGAPTDWDLTDVATVWGAQGNPPIVVGQIYYGYARFQSPDGRLSTPAYFGPITAVAAP